MWMYNWLTVLYNTVNHYIPIKKLIKKQKIMLFIGPTINFLPSIALCIQTRCTRVDLERSFQKPTQFSVSRSCFLQQWLEEVGAESMARSSGCSLSWHIC